MSTSRGTSSNWSNTSRWGNGSDDGFGIQVPFVEVVLSRTMQAHRYRSFTYLLWWSCEGYPASNGSAWTGSDVCLSHPLFVTRLKTCPQQKSKTQPVEMTGAMAILMAKQFKQTRSAFHSAQKCRRTQSSKILTSTARLRSQRSNLYIPGRVKHDERAKDE